MNAFVKTNLIEKIMETVKKISDCQGFGSGRDDYAEHTNDFLFVFIDFLWNN